MFFIDIYNIYINKLENLQTILSHNIFKEESLKNIIILNNIYEFHYIEKMILYNMIKSTIIKYFPIINYIFLCFRYEDIYNKSLLNNIFSFFKNIKNINTLKIIHDESYKSLFIDDFLNYISINNIKINVLKWKMYLNLKILCKLCLNKNIYNIIIINNYKNRKYMKNQKWRYIFKEKIRLENLF